MPGFYWERLCEEWALADLILANSEWSAHALAHQGVKSEKIIIVPLSIDIQTASARKLKNSGDSLKVLWLGSVILRKGIQYLVEAARELVEANIEFLVAGPIGISKDAIRTFPPNIRLLGPVTRDETAKIYGQADVFVLPTISDGFAITQLEAMAFGLPVIVTPNCGRVVSDGVDGFIVPPRNSEALAEVILRLCRDRDLVSELSRNALQTVKTFQIPSNAKLINQKALSRLSQFAA